MKKLLCILMLISTQNSFGFSPNFTGVYELSEGSAQCDKVIALETSEDGSNTLNAFLEVRDNVFYDSKANSLFRNLVFTNNKQKSTEKIEQNFIMVAVNYAYSYELQNNNMLIQQKKSHRYFGKDVKCEFLKVADNLDTIEIRAIGE